METTSQNLSQDAAATTTDSNNLKPSSDESKTISTKATTLTPNANLSAMTSPQIRGQSHSPISVSGSDSAVVSSALSESMETPNLPTSGNGVVPSLPQPHNITDFSIEDALEGEHSKSQSLARETQHKNHDSDKMEIDDPASEQGLDGNKQIKKEGYEGNGGIEVKRDDIAGNLKDDSARMSKIQYIQETLENMENVRLELIPLLLDIVEQVKNGELSIKDVDNACGRIRVRISRLQESRNNAERELQVLEDENNGSRHCEQDIEQRIQQKSDAISQLVNAIKARKDTWETST